MKIEEIDDLISDYQALHQAVTSAGKTHLKEQHRRYAELEQFYVEDGHVVAVFTYYGPYSGRTEVKLLPEEIATFRVSKAG